MPSRSQLQHGWGPEQEQAARLDPTLQRRQHPRQHQPQPPPPEWQQEEPRYVSITTDEVRDSQIKAEEERGAESRRHQLTIYST